MWYQDFSRFVHLKGLRGRSIKTYLGWVGQLTDHYPATTPPDLEIWAHIKIKRIDPMPNILNHSEVAKLLCTFRGNSYRAFP